MSVTIGRDDASDVLEAARQGDEDAFATLVRPYDRELHRLCYRMLGSVDDADDALQETLVRAWRGLSGFKGRSGLRTWLFRIATNACLNRLAGQQQRTVPLEFGPAADIGDDPGDMLDRSLWLGPYPDRLLAADEAERPDAVAERMESLELAFLVAVHRLSPRARAVLILRAVLEFTAQETADMLDLSVAAVNSALQRARAAVKREVPMPTQQATTRELGAVRVRELVDRYARALADGDVPALLKLLHDDATWCMPPMPAWYRGKEAIASFLRNSAFHFTWRHIVTAANGQPAVGCYVWDERNGEHVAAALDVLTLSGDRIAAVTAFVDPRALALCGLPDRLPRDP